MAIDLKPFLDAFPAPNESQDRKVPSGILSNADKPAMDKAVTTALAGGDEVITALAGMLREADPDADSKPRHLIHAMVLRVGGSEQDRRKLAGALASAIRDDQPAEVRDFLLQQLRLIADEQNVASIVRWLTDEQSSAPAIAVLLSVGKGAAEAIRVALPRSTGRVRLGLVQALGDLRDETAAPAITALLSEPDVETRTTAARALSHIGKADSADSLLKASDSGEGFERVAMTDACLTLAQTLAASGNREAARGILTHLRDTRSEPSEAYVRQVAERALSQAK